MANLDKSIEEEILAIVEKYQKENTKLLNYLITDDEITFFSPVANGSQITAEDLQKVADILKGSFEGMEIVNQEYRFKFKCGLEGVFLLLTYFFDYFSHALTFILYVIFFRLLLRYIKVSLCQKLIMLFEKKVIRT